MPFRPTLLGTALGVALALGMLPAQAQNSVDPSPTAAQTVKPPAGSGMKAGRPSSASQAESPTITQTVQPASSGKARARARMKRQKAAAMPAGDAANMGSGSSGTAAGRVENSTNSNEKGQPGKRP